MTLHPIGFFHSSQTEPYQAGRQPDEFGEPGEIELLEGMNFEQAVTDLESVTHVWVLFGFHHNTNWKPMVQTPRSEKKIGVFATRAPYRPNPIGLSLVKVISLDGLKIKVAESDILDQSPVYDIKPYHPESDYAAEARIGWLESEDLVQHQISFSPIADEQMGWLFTHGLKELKPFIFRQLEFDPTNHKKKRVEENTGYFTLSYRTWRIDFAIVEHTIGIMGIRSGYTPEELQNPNDIYNDKKLHQQFNQHFE